MSAKNFTHRILLQLITKFIGLSVGIIKVIIIISKIIHTLSFIITFRDMLWSLILPS